MRKFASKQTIKQRTNGSNTEATLILCGYSGERANNRGDSTTERRMKEEKIRKFAYRQTIRQSDNQGTVQRLRPL